MYQLTISWHLHRHTIEIPSVEQTLNDYEQLGARIGMELPEAYLWQLLCDVESADHYEYRLDIGVTGIEQCYQNQVDDFGFDRRALRKGIRHQLRLRTLLLIRDLRWIADSPLATETEKG